MSWSLSPIPSAMGEQSGDSSMIGFRGTRFSISKKGELYMADYSGEFTFHVDSGNYVHQVRRVMGPGWAGRGRIRCGGDTYCTSVRSWTYVGNTDLGDREVFFGYVLGASDRLPLHPPPPSLYSGPHTHGQVGERWTIPQEGFARRSGAIGNVGNKISKGDWSWSASEHSEFIRRMRDMFHLEEWLRFYITCYGYIIRPIGAKFWEAYGIDIQSQYATLIDRAPSAAKSVKTRIDNRGDGMEPNVYFVCGHVDDIMGGSIPKPDDDDPRTPGFDQDKKKWG